jgi:hypothetical protein
VERLAQDQSLAAQLDWRRVGEVVRWKTGLAVEVGSVNARHGELESNSEMAPVTGFKRPDSLPMTLRRYAGARKRLFTSLNEGVDGAH